MANQAPTSICRSCFRRIALTGHGRFIEHPVDADPTDDTRRCLGSGCWHALHSAPELPPGRGDFSIGSDVWPGISKLIEEASEVGQVCGKLIGSCGDPKHWDGTDLRVRLHEELGDLLAAVAFVVQHNRLDPELIAARRARKLTLFNTWHESNPDNAK